MNFAGLVDSWPERGGVVTVVVMIYRLARWLWKRKAPATKDGGSPFFRWVATIINAVPLLALMTLKYKTALARIDQLEEQMREAGVPIPPPSSSPGGERSSYDLPGSTLVRSRTNGTPPSATTSLPLEKDLL